MWVKYKHRFAYGNDKKWKYIEIPDDIQTYSGYEKYDTLDKAVGEWLSYEESITDEYDYSDKYRGFKYEIVKGYPPYEEIQRRLKNAKDWIEHYTIQRDELQKILNEIGTITKNDMKI